MITSFISNDATSTNMQASPVVNAMDESVRLMILSGCNAETRCEYWLGALNGEHRRGCGINVLRFMGEIDEENANIGLDQAINSGQGTPFIDIVESKCFNECLQPNFMRV